MTRMTRRAVNGAFLGLVAAAALPASPAGAQAAPDAVGATIAAVEARLKARLGVAIVDLASGKRWAHRADERFAMCSTVKALAAGAILARVDHDEDKLERRVAIAKSDLVPYAPAVEKAVGGEMTLDQLCEAAVTLSDNAAANLILRALGGPEALTGYLRGLGDTETRLDRWEPDLNEARPGDPRDTSTPAALVANLEILLQGTVLKPASRAQLAAWLSGNKTGDSKVRAGIPATWRAGDKTGSGGYGTSNDIGILWPPRRKPILFAILMTETETVMADKNAGMADIARAVVAAVGA